MAGYREEVGTRLCRMREGMDLSQEDAAHGIGVAAKTVFRWEKGYSWPKPDNWRAILDFYSADPREDVRVPSEADSPPAEEPVEEQGEEPNGRLVAALKDAVSAYGDQLKDAISAYGDQLNRIEELLKRALAPPADADRAQPAAGPPTPEGELGHLLSDDQPSQQARRRKRRRRAEGGQPDAGE